MTRCGQADIRPVGDDLNGGVRLTRLREHVHGRNSTRLLIAEGKEVRQPTRKPLSGGFELAFFLSFFHLESVHVSVSVIRLILRLSK